LISYGDRSEGDKMENEQAVRFFYDHAGWNHDPKTETSEDGRWVYARELARAEQWASEYGVQFTWNPDPDDDGSSEYKRVIQAEIAVELMADVAKANRST
jgi:hypothetical protein